MLSEWLEKLNKQQRQVVEELAENLLVMAPAGTGKTHVIALRVAAFMEDGVPPEEILCLTFTNKAAQELGSRLVKLLGPAGQKVEVRTFHGFCYQLIRIQKRLPAAIVDEEDGMALLKETVPEAELVWDKAWSYVQELKLFKLGLPGQTTWPDAITAFQNSSKGRRFYSQLKNSQRGAATLDYLGGQTLPLLLGYQQRLAHDGLLDFTDLITQAHELFSDEEVLEGWRKKFQVMMVDEIQDTSLTEYGILSKLGKGMKFSGFGDFNQTIYEWRDSDPKKIHDLIMDEFKAVKMELSLNYRSTQKLVNFGASYLNVAKSHHLIESELSPKQILAGLEEAGKQPVFYEAGTKENELAFIANHLKAHRLEQLADSVVLTRSNRQCIEAATALRQQGIPCYLADQFAFFRRKSVKDILSLVRYLINPLDALSLERCLPLCFGSLNVKKVTHLPFKRRMASHGMRLTDIFEERTYALPRQEPYGLLLDAFATGRVVVFDVESTGLDVTRDEVIQIAAIEFVAGREGRRFEKFIDPTGELGASGDVHGFSKSFLEERGEAAAGVFQAFLEFAKDGVLVGHNVHYDLSILSSHMKRLGLDFDPGAGYYDTLQLARLLHPGLANHKLETLSRELKTVNRPTHDAMDDILATGEILVSFLKELELGAGVRQGAAKYFKKEVEPALEELRIYRSAFEELPPGDFIRFLCNRAGVLSRSPWAAEARERENLDALLAYLDEAGSLSAVQSPGLPAWELWSRLLNHMSLSGSDLDRAMKSQNRLAVITVHQS